MKTIESIFDNLGRAITSLAAVIFVMLMVITGMIFFSHTLFNHVFPATMEEWEKRLATWLMALGWEFTVLLTTVNTRHINRNIPLVMAVCSGIIVLFFIQAFDTTTGWLVVSQRWFVAVLAATINYIYAELFYAKWMERNEKEVMPTRLVETESKLVELQSAFDEAQRNLVQLQSTLDDRGRRLVELERYRREVQAELTCEHCNTPQKSYGALRAHKGHCKSNPINSAKLNGTQVV